MRAACFVHEAGAPFDPQRFLVVKRYGADPKSKAWEPTKGQMEGKIESGVGNELLGINFRALAGGGLSENRLGNRR